MMATSKLPFNAIYLTEKLTKLRCDVIIDKIREIQLNIPFFFVEKFLVSFQHIAIFVRLKLMSREPLTI